MVTMANLGTHLLTDIVLSFSLELGVPLSQQVSCCMNACGKALLQDLAPYLLSYGLGCLHGQLPV